MSTSTAADTSDDIVATPLPADVSKDTPDAHIFRYLKGMKDQLASQAWSGDVDLLHSRILSWKNGQEKAQQWEEAPAYVKERMVFSEFKQLPWRGFQVRIALAITYFETWVRTSKDEQVNPNMHAWVALVIKGERGQGKRFVFWDSDFTGRLAKAEEKAEAEAHDDDDDDRVLHYRQRTPFLLSRQIDLIKAWSDVGGKTRDVWIGGGGNDAGDEQCLILTLKWLERLCRGELGNPNTWSGDDLKGHGFTLLDRK